MSDYWFEIFGKAVAGLLIGAIVITALLIGALVITALLLLFAFIVRNAPRLHIGRPKPLGELSFYSRQEILIARDGTRREPIGRGELIHAPLQIRWWFGLSSRNTHRWWFGFMRTDPSPSRTPGAPK